MNEPAAIHAQVVDIQNDRQHKGFIKVTLHVAVERGPALTDVLGWPTYMKPVDVGLARIGASHSALVDGDATATPLPLVASASGESRPSKYLVRQAGMMCEKPRFQLFLEKTFLPNGDNCDDDEKAAEIVRHLCDVKSRAEIIEGSAAADKWERLLWRYDSWKAGIE